jgi:hypothetical protein
MIHCLFLQNSTRQFNVTIEIYSNFYEPTNLLIFDTIINDYVSTDNRIRHDNTLVFKAQNNCVSQCDVFNDSVTLFPNSNHISNSKGSEYDDEHSANDIRKGFLSGKTNSS